MKKLLWILFFLPFLFEGRLTTLPLTLNVILIYYIFNRTYRIFLIAFLAGIILDIVSLRILGLSSLFLLIFLFISILYEKKFEIKTTPFVLFFSFLGSFFFLLLTGANSIIFQAIVNSLLAVFLFNIIKRFDLVKGGFLKNEND